MTSTLATTAAELLAPAALAAGRSLPLTETVTPGPDAGTADLAGAVIVPFTGSISGELAIMVDTQVIAAIPPAMLESQGLGAALASAIGDITAALGPVNAGVPQQVDARMAANRIASHGDSASAALTGAGGVRAVVAIGVDPRPNGTAAPQPGGMSLDRLDLLRGVEMQASAELGRARMTINDLLSLRNGAVIELDRAAGDPADLFVNGRLIARGEVVVVDENYALRITQIVTEEIGR